LNNIISTIDGKKTLTTRIKNVKNAFLLNKYNFYYLTKTLPFAISPKLFHSKLKTLLFNKSYPDSSSPAYSINVYKIIVHQHNTSFMLPSCLVVIAMKKLKNCQHFLFAYFYLEVR